MNCVCLLFSMCVTALRMFIVYNVAVVVAPSVRAPSQLLGAPLGSDVQLNCQVEASPAPVSYWLKGGKLPGSLGNSLIADIGQPRPEMLLDG